MPTRDEFLERYFYNHVCWQIKIQKLSYSCTRPHTTLFNSSDHHVGWQQRPRRNILFPVTFSSSPPPPPSWTGQTTLTEIWKCSAVLSIFFSFFNAAHTRHRYASQAGQNSKKKIDTKVYTLLAWRRQTWRLIDFCCFLVLFVAINFAMKKDKNSNILFTAFSF